MDPSGQRRGREQTKVRFLGSDVAIVMSVGRTVMRGKSEPAPERDSIHTLVPDELRGLLFRASKTAPRKTTDLSEARASAAHREEG